MRLPQLPDGARFEYQGRIYVKTGPMTAAAEDGGGLKMIPRSAVLRPLDGAGAVPAPAAAARPLDEAKVLAAFDAFHATCERLVPEPARAELAAARERFLRGLR